MDAIEAIISRRSYPPPRIVAPAPSPAQIEQLLEAAAAAPDHGKLKPWRFIVVEGEGRARLGELFARALAAENPDWSEAELSKHRDGPLRAPMILIVAAALQPDHPKIPEVEQIASAAAATQNLLIAAQAMGFAAKWATGKPAYSANVRRGLGLAEHDRVIAIIYLGTPAGELPLSPKPSVREVARAWP